jgi:hypothetical protein
MCLAFVTDLMLQNTTYSCLLTAKKIFCPKEVLHWQFEEDNVDFRAYAFAHESGRYDFGPPHVVDDAVLYIFRATAYFYHPKVVHFCTCVWRRFAEKCTCVGYGQIADRLHFLPKISFKGELKKKTREYRLIVAVAEFLMKQLGDRYLLQPRLEIKELDQVIEFLVPAVRYQYYQEGRFREIGLYFDSDDSGVAH